MSRISDEQLVAKSLRGSDRAFELLLSRYLKPVYNFLYRLTRDLSMSDDLAQETFFKAWKNLRRFDQKKSFKTWLYTIARNTAYDYLRKKRPTPFAHFEDESGNSWIDNVADEDDLPNELLVKLEQEKEITEIINKIPPNYQLILLMRYKDDFSLGEIAQILRKPYNTIKSQHQRALRNLRKVIEDKK
jgi:RNA polymerase sigma-70 factor, ECF subfamily